MHVDGLILAVSPTTALLGRSSGRRNSLAAFVEYNTDKSHQSHGTACDTADGTRGKTTGGLRGGCWGDGSGSCGDSRCSRT